MAFANLPVLSLRSLNVEVGCKKANSMDPHASVFLQSLMQTNTRQQSETQKRTCSFRTADDKSACESRIVNHAALTSKHSQNSPIGHFRSTNTGKAAMCANRDLFAKIRSPRVISPVISVSSDPKPTTLNQACQHEAQ